MSDINDADEVPLARQKKIPKPARDDLTSTCERPTETRSVGRRLSEFVGQSLVHFLDQPTGRYAPFMAIDPDLLKRSLKPGDVLLVEGNTRLSAAIKFLTQSTWSHAALYVGDALRSESSRCEPNELIEALASEGVVGVPLSKYAHFNVRLCRPVGLSAAECDRVIAFAVASLGKQYDIGHIIDLARYLLPYPPVPVSIRRRMLAFCSGDPTRSICSTLIAEAFHSVGHPVLPQISRTNDTGIAMAPYVEREIEHIQKCKLFTPRDFDVSPYFSVIKPTACGSLSLDTNHHPEI